MSRSVTPDSFGACLVQLLSDRHVSVRALADALNVERSLVYKWQRGERTPHLSSPYMARIATVLTLTPAEQATLENCQLQSLRSPRLPRSPRQPVGGQVQRLLNLDSVVEPRPRESPRITVLSEAAQQHFTLSGTSEQTSEESVEDSPAVFGGDHWQGHRPSVICERGAAWQATLEMIEGAPAPTSLADPAVHTILITSLEWGGHPESEIGEFSTRWPAVAKRAMERGWHFCHLMRLDKNARRSLSMARLILYLMGSGRYRGLFLYASEFMLPAYDMAVIPGVAAVLHVATQTSSLVDTALILREPEQIGAIHAFFQQVAAKAKPLLQTFPAGDCQALECLRVEEEEHYGARMLVKDGLSQITEPVSWSSSDSPWAQRTGYSGEALSELIEIRKRRTAIFETQVRQFQFRDICPMRAVTHMVQEGRDLQNVVVDSRIAMPVASRIEQLENVIRLLRTYDKYELALVDGDQEEDIPIMPDRFWEVIGGMRVCTNIHVRDCKGQIVHTGIVIAEPSLVGAFQQYFDDLWRRIAPRNKDKDFVIWWLERQRETLR